MASSPAAASATLSNRNTADGTRGSGTSAAAAADDDSKVASPSSANPSASREAITCRIHARRQKSGVTPAADAEPS